MADHVHSTKRIVDEVRRRWAFGSDSEVAFADGTDVEAIVDFVLGAAGFEQLKRERDITLEAVDHLAAKLSKCHAALDEAGVEARSPLASDRIRELTLERDGARADADRLRNAASPIAADGILHSGRLAALISALERIQ